MKRIQSLALIALITIVIAPTLASCGCRDGGEYYRSLRGTRRCPEQKQQQQQEQQQFQ